MPLFSLLLMRLPGRRARRLIRLDWMILLSGNVLPRDGRSEVCLVSKRKAARAHYREAHAALDLCFAGPARLLVSEFRRHVRHPAKLFERRGLCKSQRVGDLS